MSRNESTWLTLRAGLEEIFLQEHHQSYTVLHNFQYPGKQTPQMIALIGQQTKSLSMHKLRFGLQSQDDNSGEIHLRADQDSLKHQSPILFADCELHNSLTIDYTGSEKLTRDIVRRPLKWHNPVSRGADPLLLAHMLYAKLIAPFSTVICFFAEDFGGLPLVAKVLASWLISFSNRPSDLPASTHSRVLILTRGEDSVNFDEQTATRRFILELGRESERHLGNWTGRSSGKAKQAELSRLLLAQFGGLRVLKLPSLDATPRTWRVLRSKILQDSLELHTRRKEAQVAFSAPHLTAFFHAACDHFCTDIVSPFNFIRASRVANPVPTELPSNLTTFLSLVDDSRILNFAVPVIASALVYNSYLDRMHSFLPASVFKYFFYQLCLCIDPFVAKGLPPVESSPQFTTAIEASFCQYASEVASTALDGITVHRKVLSRFPDVWKNIQSNVICLSCLSRRPEDTLQCRHSLCAPCTTAHGQSDDVEPWTFQVDHCPLCREPNGIKFHHKPDTAGVRAIIAEGGGIRGVIPLTFLQELEKVIDLPMKVQEHFDIAFGSSSGGLIILGLYFNQWSVAQCLDQFQSLSTQAFQKSTWLNLKPFKLVRSFLEVLLSFTTDSRYSSTGINNALKSAFGDNSPFFGGFSGGTKVAIVASTTHDSSTCILANYNGQGRRSQDCGYKFVRPTSIGKELLIWQAARASTAAPTYFKSFKGYHDGGLGGHNNPINLALWEQDTIWSRQKKQPDAVLSLGTGFKRRPDVDDEVEENLSFFRARRNSMAGAPKYPFATRTGAISQDEYRVLWRRT
ncbi:Uncharacterized protein BP5553_01141 [Venustampulla echinocandica]|uniref:PNPLA domain-containing protein n=1 Tax=Venustampulla echinocandica TaxID=2656787 RepID=A0A370U049_9HELO|nr:Uncharacterized protein BP5553_01141 [Venustampulla echinocandica]RDL41162.1 Uncharacterized protein BP5553_01141 [Venustampulla echinocandica]